MAQKRLTEKEKKCLLPCDQICLDIYPTTYAVNKKWLIMKVLVTRYVVKKNSQHHKDVDYEIYYL